MKKRTTWLRLDADVFRSADVLLGKCGAVYPWLLAKLRLHDGECTYRQIHPLLAAEDLGIPERLAAEQIDGAKRMGLLVPTDAGWTAPEWKSFLPDARSHSRRRGK